MRCLFSKLFHIVIVSVGLLTPMPPSALESATALRKIYMQEVDLKLAVPQDEQRFYAERISHEQHQI